MEQITDAERRQLVRLESFLRAAQPHLATAPGAQLLALLVDLELNGYGDYLATAAGRQDVAEYFTGAPAART